MPAVAKLKYLRVAPRKMRLVADLIRGKSVEEAKTILNFTNKKAAFVLTKLLKSAIANAKNLGLEEKNLFISKITVDEGPKYKRWMPRARGAASEIQKKTSHITLILDEIIRKPRRVEKIKKLEKTEKVERVEKVSAVEKAREEKPPIKKAKLKPELEIPKPKTEKGIRRIFKRKAF